MLNYIPFTQTDLTGAFWDERYRTIRDTTATAILDRFRETGRMDSIRMEWKPGDPNEPHIFWDSDVTKWIEGVAYLLAKNDLPELEAEVDRLVDIMEATQEEDGYLNTYFTVVEPGKRFTKRVDHELYCAGHLLEAALAYAQSTGKMKLLDIACRYIDLIDRVFRVEQSAAFDSPGHQEIELALYKLFDYTGEERYKLLADYFLDMRGRSERDDTYEGYDLDHLQTHLPIMEQMTAEGHSVRMLYMLAAMADRAKIEGNQNLLDHCKHQFDHITTQRMYITGAIGSTYLGESFTIDYDLPSDTAYAETCASIAMAFFARRMALIDPRGAYADAAEQSLYNTALGGLSISGDAFYYENPLKVDLKRHQFYDPRPSGLRPHLPIITRAKVFECSCCPPNIMRLVASIGDFLYTEDEDTLYTQCYMQATTKLDDDCVIEQETAYPYDGRIRFTYRGETNLDLALRIPAWCESYTISRGGSPLTIAKDQTAYAHIPGPFHDGEEVELELAMPVRLIQANPQVVELSGQVAVMRGPLVYCAEGVDNPDINVHDIRFDAASRFTPETITIDGLDVPSLLATATVREVTGALYEPYPQREIDVTARLIPYFTWANRGENDMTCWFRA